jgi:signal peptidase I
VRTLLAAGSLTTIVLAGFSRRFILVRVVGTSMCPSFLPGELVIARRLRVGERCNRGDVIVFETPRHLSKCGPAHRIKRAVAVGGDPVPSWLELSPHDVPAGAVVPPGSIVVVGDAEGSESSRQLGFVPADAIVAVAPLGPRFWRPRRRRTT